MSTAPVVSCPRQGCGGPVNLTQGGKITTHKLPDGWRACSASGMTLEEAAQLIPPNLPPGCNRP